MTTSELVLKVAEYLGVIAVMMLIGLSPRMRMRRTVAFKYPLREGVMALSLFALVLLVAFIVFIKFFTPIHPDQLLYQRLIVAVIGLIPFAASLLVRGQPLRSIGWTRENQDAAIRIGMCLAFLTVFIGGKIFTIVNGLTSQQWIALPVWLGIAVAEETIFRGYIQPRLGSWLGLNWGWAISSVLYGLWQLPHLLANPTTLVIRLCLAIVQGVFLGWIMRRSGHIAAPALYRALTEWVSML